MPEQTDYFALLDVPRLASLDADALKARYLAITRETHPDAGLSTAGNSTDSAEINSAYNCLSQPSSRLRHLLELIAPGAKAELRGGEIPAPLMEIFAQLATAVQKADAIIGKKKAATSALSVALLASAEMEVREGLEAAGFLIAEQRAALESQALPEIDSGLRSAPDSNEVHAKIANAFRAFGFLDKWQAQVRGKLLEMIEAGG